MTQPPVRRAARPGVDDPARPSGGNVYDRRVLDGLARAAAGRVVELAGRRRLADARTWPTSPGWTRCWSAVPDGVARPGRRAGRLGRGVGAPAPRRPGCASWCCCTCRSGPTAGEETGARLGGRRGHDQRVVARARARLVRPAPRVDVALPGVDPVDAGPPHRSAGRRHVVPLRRRRPPRQGPRPAARGAGRARRPGLDPDLRRLPRRRPRPRQPRSRPRCTPDPGSAG